MKKLLLVAVMGLIALGVATDAFGLFGRRAARWGAYGAGFRRGYYGGGYYGGGYGSGYGRCGSGGCAPCYEEEQCPPPPCCEREQVITVREAPYKVCGWVCPDGTREIPTSQANLVD